MSSRIDVSFKTPIRMQDENGFCPVLDYIEFTTKKGLISLTPLMASDYDLSNSGVYTAHWRGVEADVDEDGEDTIEELTDEVFELLKKGKIHCVGVCIEENIKLPKGWTKITDGKPISDFAVTVERGGKEAVFASNAVSVDFT